ncbi:uncharacterized protein [Drosophila tropicalis]|uniref:uncharacterized protein n=1 Tax=Drosophila tropicalis TaxID=46794 RepID=UPI0035ABF2B0
MISHTVRVFKLMYIVAGILISNEEICDTVDRIQIAPRVEMKPEFDQRRALTSPSSPRDGEEQPSSKSSKKRRVSVTGLAGGMVRGVTSQVTKRVGNRFGWLYDVRLILQQWRTLALSFNLWTIPNFLMECSTSYISKKFFLNSDCDLIYK